MTNTQRPLLCSPLATMLKRGIGLLPSVLMLLPVLIGVGCESYEIKEVEIHGLEPNFRITNTQLNLEISGAGFIPIFKVNPHGDGEIKAVFEAYLHRQLDGSGPFPLQNVRYLNPELLTATVPVGLEPGVYDLTLVSPHGKQAELVGAFDCRLPPFVTDVDPIETNRNRRAPVVITGLNFMPDSVALIGGVPIEDQEVQSERRILGYTPTSETSGERTVCVTSFYGPDMEPERCWDGSFTYRDPPPAPELISITPDLGPAFGGNQVALEVRNLTLGSQFWFGGEQASNVTLNVDERLATMTVPPGEAGWTSIRIRTNQGEATFEETYLYEGQPVVTAVEPNVGSAAGGDEVTVLGEWLVEGTVVEFGGHPLRDVEYSADATSIRGITPDGRGTVLVRAFGRGKNPQGGGINGDGLLPNGFTFRSSPRISAVVPAMGPENPPQQGFNITVHGDNFQQDHMELVVGGKRVSPITVAPNGREVSGLLPPGKGTVSVALSTSDGSASLLDGFIYRPKPEVHLIEPRQGWGGDTIRLIGMGLNRCQRLVIGGFDVEGIGYEGDEQLIGVLPMGLPGSADLLLECGVYGNIHIEAAFAFKEPRPTLAVNHVVPMAGSIAGGNLMWVQGTGLTSEVVVAVGGAPLENVTFFGDTALSGVVPSGEQGYARVVVDRGPDREVWHEDYHYQQAPSLNINSIEPQLGSIGGGMRAVLFGTGFTPDMVVTIGGKALHNQIYISPTRVEGIIPAGDEVTQVVVFAYSNEGACWGCHQEGDQKVTFSYVDDDSAVWGTILPTTGPRDGYTRVTITGAGLDDIERVYLGPVPAVLLRRQDTPPHTITGFTPGIGPADIPTVDVRIRFNNHPEREDLVARGVFTYHEDDQFSFVEVDPAVGQANSAHTVHVRGSAFTPGDPAAAGRTVQVFNDQGVTVFANEVVSPTDGNRVDFQVEIPALSPGRYNVTVTDGDNRDTVLGAYRVEGALATISQVEPLTGPSSGGTLLTLQGTNFAPDSRVFVGNLPLVGVRVTGDHTIEGRTPPGIGNAPIRVESWWHSIGTGSEFIYTAAPETLVISSVWPDQGPSRGGTALRIAGHGLDQVTGGRLGDVELDQVQVVHSSLLLAITPSAGDGAGEALELVLYGSNPGEEASIDAAFTYIAGPTVDSITPSQGLARGGDLIEIVTSDLGVEANVYLGEAPLGNMQLDPETGIITGITPPGTGTVDVRVENRWGDTIVSGGFTYEPYPQIHGVDPPIGSVFGNTPVTISGSGFVEGMSVHFGYAPMVIETVTENTITGRTPAGWGKVDLVATTHRGAGTLADGFTFMGAPIISEIYPKMGSVEGGTLVVIRGSNFADTTLFSIDGQPLEAPAEGAGNYVGVTMAAGMTPPSATTGAVDVAANDQWGEGLLVEGFRYVDRLSAILSEDIVAPVVAVSACEDSYVWASGGNWLVRLDTRDDSTASYPMDLITGRTILSLECVRPGLLVIGTDSGLASCAFSEAGLMPCRIVNELDLPSVSEPLGVVALGEFAGGLLVGATNFGAVIFPARGGIGADAVRLVDVSQGLPDPVVGDIASIDAHTGLLATRGGVAMVDFRDTRVTAYTQDNSNLSSPTVLSVASAGGDAWYMGLDDGMDARWPRADSGHYWNRVQGLPEGGVHALLSIDGGDDVWAALEHGGVALVSYDNVVELLDEADGPLSGVVVDMTMDPNGAVYFAAEGGLVRLSQ